MLGPDWPLGAARGLAGAARAQGAVGRDGPAGTSNALRVGIEDPRDAGWGPTLSSFSSADLGPLGAVGAAWFWHCAVCPSDKFPGL